MFRAVRFVAANIALAFVATSLATLAYVWGSHTSVSEALDLAITAPLFMVPKVPFLLGILISVIRAALIPVSNPRGVLLATPFLGASVGVLEGFWLTFRSIHLAMPRAILAASVSWFAVFALFGVSAHLWRSCRKKVGRAEQGTREGTGAA